MRNATETGTKYHHGPARRCPGCVIALSVLVDEEEFARSRGCAAPPATNHGSAIAANTASPAHEIAVGEAAPPVASESTYSRYRQRPATRRRSTPLVSTARRAHRPCEQHRIAGARRPTRARPARRRKAHSAQVMNAVSIMSSVTNCAPDEVAAARCRGSPRPSSRRAGSTGGGRWRTRPATPSRPASAGQQARGPFVLAGHGEDRGRGPVLQRRLLEIRQAVDDAA